VSGGAGSRERLAGLSVLVLDAQATAADPGRGALLEIGWARFAAAEARELAPEQVTAHLVAPPPGAVMPRGVARVTGLSPGEWARGMASGPVWEQLLCAARGVASLPGPVPVVIHFARFEEPYLRALHVRHGAGVFPFDLVCTHAIARRLLPALPRRTLRALAGYFGAGVPPRRRSAFHVIATALVWRHLVAMLGEREGITRLDELGDWLARPALRAPRSFPLARERRLALPDRPGVYRLLRAGGAVLYVGKAASLRQRVSGHFHAHAGQGERALEMLSQVRDVSWCVSQTALEAALLEADEIKRLAPPFNIALAPAGRSVWFARADLSDPQPQPDPEHGTGPFVSPAPLEALAALRTLLADGELRPASLPVRARVVAVEPEYAPGPECFAAGLVRFRREHGGDATTRGALRLGARLWARRRSAVFTPGPDEGAGHASERPRRPRWDEERVAQALEDTVLRAAHAARRARWLVRLSECALAFTAVDDSEALRLLVFQGGALVARADVERGTPLPVPPGHARPAAERRAAFDLASFDRLRVLTSELRVLAAGAASVELRLGPHVRLARPRLQAVLRWL